MLNPKKIIRKVIPLKFLLPIFNFYLIIKWEIKGIKIRKNNFFYSITKSQKQIRLPIGHSIYLLDTLENFDFYFNGVAPIKINGFEIVDYSVSNYHDVKDFSLMPIFFPSVAEPVLTTHQYLDFAKLEPTSIVIDIGAYSGLTSIIFDQEIKGSGKVISIEADPANQIACKKNYDLYYKITSRTIELVNAAVWKSNDGILFSSEGSMGSSASSIVGSDRGGVLKMVNSITLESLASKYDLQKVDFIKCDIEGAETEIFHQPNFFSKFKPKIIIECHLISGKLTIEACKLALGKFGYKFEIREQEGYPLPLLFCTPKQ